MHPPMIKTEPDSSLLEIDVLDLLRIAFQNLQIRESIPASGDRISFHQCV